MKSFPGLVDRKSGTVTVDTDAVDFVPDDQVNGTKLHIPLYELELAVTGENDAFFVLKRQGGYEAPIVVQDRALLEVLSRYGVADATKVLRRAARRAMRRRLCLALFFGFILFLLVLLPLLLSKIPGKWVERLVSTEAERILTHTLVESESLVLLKNDRARGHLTTLLNVLEERSPELTPLKTKVFLNRSSDVNAFALPGAVMVMQSGLILEAQTIEEVLGVMAHELGHIQERHAIKGMVSSFGFLSGVGLMGFVISPDLTLIFMRGGKLTLLKHSRDQEREADLHAMTYLKNAGVSGEGAVAFFERLQKKGMSGAVDSVLSILSTHPVSAERVRAMRTFLAAHPYATDSKIPVTLEELKAAVR